MEKKIRKEIKYSSDEWDKVIELSAKSGKLPAAYIRDKALIAIHKIIQALDTSGIIVERGGKNAEYRSTRINGKSIRKKS